MEDIEIKIRKFLYSNPNLLLSLSKGEAVGLRFLPYSLGFEFECHKKDDFNTSIFESIPNIMAVSISESEQRYRIPTGLNGLICLFDIANNLKKYSLLNTLGGIHIHVDFSDCFHLLTDEFIRDNEKWILDQLDQYGEDPKGYNKRHVSWGCKGNWVRVCPYYKTVEFRVFGQTFEYSELVKFAIQLNELAVELKLKLGVTYLGFDDSELKRLRDMLTEIKSKDIMNSDKPSESLYKINQIIKQRVIKWN
jgi:hypothetical protein